MGKKIFSAADENSKFSYQLGRACRHCNAPIPDHEHATREFCPVTYDSNGNVRDCKTSYHRENDKEDRELFAKIITGHKNVTSRIEFLIKKKGFQVSTEDLNTYEIQLSQALDFNISSDGIGTFVYFKHTITSNPITNFHQIVYNG